MKRQRQLLVLAGILVLVLAGIFITKSVTRHIDSIATVDEEILAVPTENVTSVSWTLDDTTLTFQKTDEGWKNSADTEFPVDTDKIEAFLKHFNSVHASFIIEDVKDFNQYGLDNPEATITLTTEEGEKTISLGTFSTMDSKRYVCLGNETVYLIDDDLKEYLSSERDDFMKQDAVPVFQQVTRYQVKGATDLDIVYDAENEHTYTKDYAYYSVKDGAYKALSTSFVNTFMNQVLNRDYTDYLTYTATDEDEKKCGLDQPEITVLVNGTVQNEKTNSDTKEAEESVTIFVSCVDEQGYLQFENSRIIYKIDADTFNEIKKGSYETLRPKEVLSLDWSKVVNLSAAVDGKDYTVTLTHETNEEGDETAHVGIAGQTDLEISIEKLQTAVQNLQLSEANETAIPKELEFSFTIALDQEQFSSIEIAMYRYDGENCVVTFDGEVIGLMEREAMTDMKEAFTSIVLSYQNGNNE